MGPKEGQPFFPKLLADTMSYELIFSNVSNVNAQSQLELNNKTST